MPIPGILEWRQLQELLGGRILERLAALEAKLATEGQQPRTLRQHNAARQADAGRLRQTIASILAEHCGPAKPTRKAVLRALERSQLARGSMPSLSAIGWHMREIRRAQPVNVNTAALTPRQ